MQGHSETEQLAVVAKKVIRPAVRGSGPARKSSPFDVPGAIAWLRAVDLFLAMVRPWAGQTSWQSPRSVRSGRLSSQRCVWNMSDWTVPKGTVQVRLPVSETDTQASAARSRGLAYVEYRGGDQTAYHRAQSQFQLLRDLFDDPLPAELPFFPNKEGRTIAEAQVVTALEATAKAMGWRSSTGARGGEAYGGEGPGGGAEAGGVGGGSSAG